MELEQEDIRFNGWSMICRVRANDPWRDFLSSPGNFEQVRLPSGAEVRVDTYISNDCGVPPEFGPLLANLTVWGPDRVACLMRLDRALQDFMIKGLPTNLPLLQRIIGAAEFVNGHYLLVFTYHYLMSSQRKTMCILPIWLLPQRFCSCSVSRWCSHGGQNACRAAGTDPSGACQSRKRM